jgi:hypothetical protein
MQEATGRPHEHGPIITNEVTDIGPVHESLWRLVPKNANRYAQLMAVSSKGFDDSSLVMEVMKGRPANDWDTHSVGKVI